MATASKTANRSTAQAKPAARPAQPSRPQGQQAQSQAVNRTQPKPQAQTQTRVQSGDVDGTSGASNVIGGAGIGGRQQQAQSAGALAERPNTAVGASATQVPDHIRNSQGRGSENVEMQDLVIPRIELVQALSKCLEEGGAEYIEGARPGMFYNSVTRELYGSSVVVCPVFFKKQFLNWRDRKKGGGFGGAYDSMIEAQNRLNEQDNPDEWEAIETAQQIVLVVNPDTHETSEAVLSCARTKMKVSRAWNSLIRMAGFDRFSRIYELFGVDETNTQNQSFKNIGVRMIDFASVPVYKAAEALYNSIASGEVKVKMDDSFIDAGMGSEDDLPPGGQGEEGASPEY